MKTSHTLSITLDRLNLNTYVIITTCTPYIEIIRESIYIVFKSINEVMFWAAFVSLSVLATTPKTNEPIFMNTVFFQKYGPGVYYFQMASDQALN